MLRDSAGPQFLKHNYVKDALAAKLATIWRPSALLGAPVGRVRFHRSDLNVDRKMRIIELSIQARYIFLRQPMKKGNRCQCVSPRFN